jgi:bacterial leucyl aminopeptidase
MVGFLAALFLPLAAQASAPGRPALADLHLLEKAGATVIAKEPGLNLGFALVSEESERKLQALAHAEGKCGGYELLLGGPPAAAAEEGRAALMALSRRLAADRDLARRSRFRSFSLAKKPALVTAMAELKQENLERTVAWLSAYPSRHSKEADPNAHVRELAKRLRELLKTYPHPFTVEEIAHSSTKQKSLRVHLEGATRPRELVVLGGHLDSLNVGWFSHAAPGADDNASGAANLIEALRVLSSLGRPARSVEFFWYAGEESGLLGSAEIAKAYKKESKDVVAVLQLDMTAFPGAGEFVLGNVSDFTSPWLQQYLVSLNETYLQAKIIPDECGYACSDHASWYRQGYPTLMPFEADTGRMNPKIHSEEDTIDAGLNFRHSLEFAKIALVFAADLGNSEARQPR